MHRRTFVSSLGGSLLAAGGSELAAAPTPLPKLRKIGGLALTVSDFERSRRFYRDVLGLQEDKIMPTGGLKFFMESGHISIWLPGQWEKANPHLEGRDPSDISGKKHCNMSIDALDADAALENLKKNKVKFRGPRHFKNGQIHIDFEAPEGHLLEYVGRPYGKTAKKSAGLPKIKEIGEIALVVKDLERSRKFYTQVLGLKEAHFGPVDAAGGLTFHFADGYLGLWLPGQWQKANPHLPGTVGSDLGGKTHLNVDIDLPGGKAAAERLKQYHAKFWGPRYHHQGEPNEDVHIDFEDPDGHLLEFHGTKTKAAKA